MEETFCCDECGKTFKVSLLFFSIYKQLIYLNVFQHFQKEEEIEVAQIQKPLLRQMDIHVRALVPQHRMQRVEHLVATPHRPALLKTPVRCLAAAPRILRPAQFALDDVLDVWAGVDPSTAQMNFGADHTRFQRRPVRQFHNVFVAPLQLAVVDATAVGFEFVD